MNSLDRNPEDLTQGPGEVIPENGTIRREPLTAEEEMRAVIEEMYRRQEVMESDLARTKAALERALNGRGRQASSAEEMNSPLTTNTLMQNLIDSLAANYNNPNKEASAPRGWKPLS